MTNPNITELNNSKHTIRKEILDIICNSSVKHIKSTEEWYKLCIKKQIMGNMLLEPLLDERIGIPCQNEYLDEVIFVQNCNICESIDIINPRFPKCKFVMFCDCTSLFVEYNFTPLLFPSAVFGVLDCQPLTYSSISRWFLSGSRQLLISTNYYNICKPRQQYGDSFDLIDDNETDELYKLLINKSHKIGLLSIISSYITCCML